MVTILEQEQKDPEFVHLGRLTFAHSVRKKATSWEEHWSMTQIPQADHSQQISQETGIVVPASHKRLPLGMRSVSAAQTSKRRVSMSLVTKQQRSLSWQEIPKVEEGMVEAIVAAEEEHTSM